MFYNIYDTFIDIGLGRVQQFVTKFIMCSTLDHKTNKRNFLAR